MPCICTQHWWVIYRLLHILLLTLTVILCLNVVFFQNPIITVMFLCDSHLSSTNWRIVYYWYSLFYVKEERKKINYFNTYTTWRMWPCGLSYLTEFVWLSKSSGCDFSFLAVRVSTSVSSPVATMKDGSTTGQWVQLSFPSMWPRRVFFSLSSK